MGLFSRVMKNNHAAVMKVSLPHHDVEDVLTGMIPPPQGWRGSLTVCLHE